MSLLQNAVLFLDAGFIPKEEADCLLHILNDDEKFERHKLYFYDSHRKTLVTRSSWRKSYWFGEYPQAVQSTDDVVDHDTGEDIEIDTDYVKPYPFPEEILSVKKRIEDKYKVQFNSCLVGKFDSPNDKIGYHSDRSDNMGDNPIVASLSFGKNRMFKMKNNKFTSPYEEKLEIDLGHGDLLLMGDKANVNYLHHVPKDPDCSCDNFRINLTFRNYTYSPDEIEYAQQMNLS